MMIRSSIVVTLAVVMPSACAKHPRPSNTVVPVATPAKYTPADVHFLAGMIGHHAQAIKMAGWAPSHDASPSLRALCERIVVAQNDEIAFAQRWLREHGEYVPPADPRGQDRKSTRLNSSHSQISYAVFCLKKKINRRRPTTSTLSLHIRQQYNTHDRV